MKKKAAKIVNSAILGMDFRTVVVAGKAYVIKPPTIKKLAGAGYWLSDIDNGESIRDVLLSLHDASKLTKALSWFINGDESLSDELSEGTLSEIADALETAYSLLSTKDFLRLSALARNVTDLTAKQRQ
jgi:hypothetical protein